MNRIRTSPFYYIASLITHFPHLQFIHLFQYRVVRSPRIASFHLKLQDTSSTRPRSNTYPLATPADPPARPKLSSASAVFPPSLEDLSSRCSRSCLTMASAKVAVPPHGSSDDVSAQALRAMNSPDRKRKQRTPESPDRNIHGHLESRYLGYDSHSPTNLSPEARHTSAHSSNSASANGTGGDDGTSSRGGGGEETLTLRRREANRLAAQRFRSRKKGYQDSLEERIRILEDEKDVIARRLDQSHQRTPQEDGYYRRTEPYPPHSPDQTGEGDVRYASLESANRRLQDELRGVMEDNARLRDEVDRWRKWEREQRESRQIEKPHHRGPALAPLDFGPMAPPSYTSSPYPPAHPPLERGHSYSHSYRPSSPGPRLPPLRLPGNGSHLTSPNGRPLLPRPESMERVSTLHNPRPQTSPANRS